MAKIERSSVKPKKTSDADVGAIAHTAEATAPVVRKSSVAKVSHTLSIALAERLEEFAFFQRVSESSVIEFALNGFFSQSHEDAELGDILRRDGAGRRRKS